MDHTADRLLPAGRGTARWFLFLVFYHLVPVPWFMFVAAGLAPGSFLLKLHGRLVSGWACGACR